MKKTIQLLFFSMCLQTIHAQNKPGKEETIAFINRTAEAAVGSIYDATRTKEITFNLTNYRRISIMEIDKGNGQMVETNKYIGTQTFPSLEYLAIDNAFELMNCAVGSDNICELWIPFKKDVKREEIHTGLASFNKNESKIKIEYSPVLAILIPKDKAEPIKKNSYDFLK